MAMDAEHDALCADIERLLNAELYTDDDDAKRGLVETAISKAATLVQQSPNNADFHHLHGLAWYHHPDKTNLRLTNIRSALQRALSIEPQHHLANQYLGYINFDVGDYATAKTHFDATDHSFFELIDQKWRSLKAIELAFVCQLRLDQPVQRDALNQFFAAYLAEERELIPNTVVPLELRRCAEWLFNQNGSTNAEPLHSIVNFLHACGDLSRSDHSGLKEFR